MALVEELAYSRLSSGGVKLTITGKEDLHSFHQVLASNNLTEIKELELVNASEKALTQLLPHLPRLSTLHISSCKTITQLVVGVDLPELEVEQEKEENGVLYFPTHLSHSLRKLEIRECLELVLVDSPTFGGGGGLQALRSLEIFLIKGCRKFLSACSFSSSSSHLFSSSLQHLYLIDAEGMGTLEPLSNLTSLQDLYLNGVEGMGTLEPLSNLTSLTRLYMRRCGEDLRCDGLLPLLTTGGHLTELEVYRSPRFFAGWGRNPNPNPSQVKLREIETDRAAGLLAAPICSLLSSSLTKLHLREIPKMKRFRKKQEDALHLLASLQELRISYCWKLQHLPAGLHKLTNLKILEIDDCPVLRSLPKDGLPKSLQELDVSACGNEELVQQCSGLAGTIPKIILIYY